MIQKITKNHKTYYICPECNFAYKDKKFAEQCEKWCKEHNSCNIEITKHSVKI